MTLEVRLPEVHTYICLACGKEFTLNKAKASQARARQKRGHAGPFCSRTCARTSIHHQGEYVSVPILGGWINKEYNQPAINVTMYEDYIHRGPYALANGRLVMQLEHKDTKNRLDVYYARYVMENHLRRHLVVGETVDHIDRDILNNDISNLRVLSMHEHLTQDVFRSIEQVVHCQYCNKEIILSKNKLAGAAWRRKQGKAGPFCSTSCSRKAIINGVTTCIPIEIEKYSLKDLGGM